MQDSVQKNIDNNVEKYIIAEILEKVYRLKKFIGAQKPLLKNNSNRETIEVFEIALSKLLDSLKYPILVLQNNKISNEERFALNRRLSTTFHLLTQFHSRLKYIYSDWVRPETYTFTKRLLQQLPIQQANSKLNIILSDEYTFRENNLTNKFNEVFRDSKISPISDDLRYPTFFLPKIEYTNPLNWAILAHEMAHINEEEINSFIEDVNLMPSGTSLQHKSVLKKWAEEIYCDIFALNFLGPAYFASFVSFALATTGFGGNWNNSFSHPSNMLRIRILHEHLIRNNVSIEINIKNLGCFEMSDFFFNMIEDFDKIDRKLLGTSISNGYVIDDLTHFNDFIREKSRHFVHGLKIEDEELHVIKCLQKRLERGITIGSYRNYDQKVLLEKLKNRDNDFDAIKSSISENGTSIREILNAGWINKVSNNFPEIIKFIFSNEDVDINEGISLIGKMIEESDDRLLKSIETSELYFLLEKI